MTFSRRGLIAAGTGVLGALPAAAAPAGAVGRTGGTSADGAALAGLRAYAGAHVAAHHLPGMTLCVTDGAGYLGLVTLGYADVKRRLPLTPGKVFQIGSITKSLVNLCILKASETRGLDLDEDVRRLAPGLEIDVTGAVPLRAVLHHAAGLPEDAPLFPRASKGLWLGFAPGSAWSYSNTGYVIATRVLERAYGAPLSSILRTEVFQPLGLAGALPAIRQEDEALYPTGYAPAEPGLPYVRGAPLAEASWTDTLEGDGCVAMSAPVMARYLAYLIRAGSGRGAPLISDAGARRFTEEAVDAPGWAPGARYAYGLARVRLDGRDLLHHTGGMNAFSSSLHVDPEAGLACFASTNVGGLNYRPRDVTRYALALHRALRAGSAPPDPPPVLPGVEGAAAYRGVYADPGGARLEVRASGPGLEVAYGGRSAALEPQPNAAFLTLHPEFRRLPLVFDPPGGRVFYGGRAFTAPGAAPGPAPDPELALLEGRYDQGDGSTVRLVARGAVLLVDGLTPATPLPDGSWRVGDTSLSPERLWIGERVNGRPERINLSGRDLYRSSDRAPTAA